MSILVVGSVALDSVETPFGKREGLLGGSATYFSFSARFFTKVKVVATVGKDFPNRYLRLFQTKNIDTAGLKVEDGDTFRWKCRYEHDLNTAHTIYTHLNVFKHFSPRLPLSYRNNEYVFLANIDPDLQKDVLGQIKKPKFIACDTMGYWIENKRGSLLRLMKKVDALFLNDSEARELTEEPNLVRACGYVLKRGPKIVIVKKGVHGSILATRNSLFSVPAYPLRDVYDPTGAGDTFAGGFFGYLSRNGRITDKTLRKAVAYGTIMASFAVESFGPGRLVGLDSRLINSRYEEFKKLTRF